MSNYTHIYVKDSGNNDQLVMETVIPSMMLELWFARADEVFAQLYGAKAVGFYYVFGDA